MLKNLRADVQSSPAALTVFFVITVLVFLFLMFTVTIVTFILPEAYASTARIKVDDSPSSVITAMEVIQSAAVLDKVIDALNLNEIWAKKYNAEHSFQTSDTRAALKRMIEIKPVGKTSLVNITVYSDDKMEAAQTANAIAETFQAYRRRPETGQASIPDRLSQVEIIERAEPNNRPVRPNKPLNIALGGVISVLVSLAAGTIMALMVSRLTRRSPKLAAP